MTLKFKHVFLHGLRAAIAFFNRMNPGAGGKVEPRGCKHEFGAMPRMLKPEAANRWRYGQETMRQIAAHERLERLAENNALANDQARNRREARLIRKVAQAKRTPRLATLLAMAAAINA